MSSADGFKETNASWRIYSALVGFLFAVQTFTIPVLASDSEQRLPDVTTANLRAEISPTIPLSLAIESAIKNYPTVRRSRASVNRASAAVRLAKTAYLPSFDLLAQELRTTTNNIAGGIFPQVLNVIPIQTGAANDTSSFKSIFASNFGFNFSWLAYDWGERKAGVQVARAKDIAASADFELTLLDVQAAVAEAYLNTVSNHEIIRAQTATVERMQAYNTIVHTQVNNGLRPGVDAARADADLSSAKIALLDAEREYELSSVDLAEQMGEAGRDVSVEDAPWIKHPGSWFALGSRADVSKHPLAIFKEKEVEEAHAQVKFIQHSYRPHLWFHSGIWARGSGSRVIGHPVADGVVPQNANYIAGFGLDFPVLDYFAVKAKSQMAIQAEELEHSNYDLAIQELTKKDARARVLLRSAEKIAEQTPVLVAAARENEIKALERYRVGLCNVLEAAEAQRIMQNASVQDAVAQVRIWRALLASAYAQGDLKPFMQIVKTAEAQAK